MRQKFLDIGQHARQDRMPNSRITNELSPITTPASAWKQFPDPRGMRKANLIRTQEPY